MLFSFNISPRVLGTFVVVFVLHFLTPVPAEAFGLIDGCTDPVACNYDPAATIDDGSCILPDGCTDPAAYNYDASANCDDGSCVDAATGMNFNANNEHVLFGTASDFPASAFTVQVMYDIGSISSYATLYHLGSPSESALEIYTQGTSNIAVVFNRNNSAQYGSLVVPNLPTGWFLLTVAYDEASGVSVYYDSNLVGTQTINELPEINTTTNAYIGTQPSNSWGVNTAAKGDYDELRIWNRKLTQEEIQFQLNCELDANHPDLYAYYSFNQGGIGIDNTTESSVLDQTGNGHNGELQNMALNGITSNWSTGSALITGVCGAIINGCTDATACNYDPTANFDDGSCLIIGQSCDDGIPCTINDVIDANCECHGTPNDGFCDDGQFCNGQEFCDPELGCQVIPLVLDDGDPCTIDTCDEATDTVIHTPAPDSDGDGICDAMEVPGCTDASANNYDPLATDDDGSCVLPGTGLHFNGVGTSSDYVFVPADATVNFGTGDFTIETWFRLENANDFSSLLTSYTVASGGWAFHRDDPFNGSNNIRFIVGNASSTGTFESIDTGPLNMNQWYHIAGVRKDSFLYLYVDGVLIGSVPSTRNLPLHPIEIGRRYTDVPQWGHKGDLDEVRLWNRALDPVEINARMNCELNGDENGLVRYYQFNQGIAFGDNTAISTVTSDHIGNPVDGTIFGMPLNGTQGNFVVGQHLSAPCGAVVYGCTDATACNYDPSANIEDGSCQLPDGCTDPTACNYDPAALCDDGSCLFPDGCTDSTACNYDVNALCDDASCIYADPGLDCNGDCLLGVEVTVTNASLPADMNGYYAVADDCVFEEGGPWFGGVDYMVCFRKNDGSDWRIWNTGCGWEIGRVEFGSWQRYARYYTGQCNEIPPEQLGFEALTTTTFYDGFGQILPGVESVLFGSSGCTDSNACNYDPAALCDDGSCVLPDGCTDSTACNYDVNALCDDGSCDYITCVGCTDPLAENYDVENTTEDGSCTYCAANLTYNTTGPEPILIGDGISNEHMAVSQNCNVSASIKAIERFIGDIVPTDGLYRIEAGESPVSGVDPTPDSGKAKWNYVLSVNLGSFTAEDVKIYLDIDFDPAVSPGAVYTADVTQVLIDNGLGTSSLAQDSQNLGFDFWQLIGDPAILPFDPFANGYYDLTVRVESLAGVELVNAPIQVEVFTLGCTNPMACNFNVNATQDDGSCLDQLGCTDAGACNYDPVANCDDNSCEFTSCLGCTDPLSCDYDPAALIDDGSCLVYPGDTCDDGNVYTSNDEVQADCGCEGVAIDSDSDGLSDELEIAVYGSDPNLQDSDYDGLTDGLEVNVAGTSPTNPDTDADGCDDASQFSGACGGEPDCPADLTGDNLVDAADLLAFLGAFGQACP